MLVTLTAPLWAPLASLAVALQDPSGTAAPHAPAAVAAPAEARSLQSIFPPVTGDLVLELPAEGPPLTMLDLVRKYGDLTGQACTWNQETQQFLFNSKLGIDRSVTIPKGDVQTFFESMLRKDDYAIRLLHEKQPQVVEVMSLNTPHRNTIRQYARQIPATEMEVARAHPAVLFTTVLELPNVDVRQVANSMRTTITDANTTQMLPAGTPHTIVLTGFGDYVADMAAVLRQVNHPAAPVAAPGENSVLEVVPLKHAIAEELAAVVETALAHLADVQAANTTAPGTNPQATPASKPWTCLVSHDARTNSLIVACKQDVVPYVHQLVTSLDVPMQKSKD